MRKQGLKKRFFGRMILVVLYVLLIILYFLYLEIFKNQIFGWLVGAVLMIAFPVVMHICLAGRQTHIKLAGAAVLLVLLALNAKLSAPPVRQVSAIKGRTPVRTEEIAVAEGLVQGVYNPEKSVEIFAGIPYAEPPVGEFRWREPQPSKPWDGVRICDTYAPMAMQARQNPIYALGSQIVGYHEFPFSLTDNYLEAMSEDCLYLNVWKPADAKEGDRLPVLFYIHGGSLNSGQSYFDAYNGEALAKQGIVVVNISYRLGVFGYLADEELAKESPNGTTGNYGLLDQIAALRWVSENVENFGGDAGNITIAGESAGSSSVNAICVSPLAKGLFRRAIAESSGITPKVPYHTFRTMEQATEIASNIKSEFDCASVEELREVPAEKLVRTSYQNNEMTVDGYVITEQPYLTYLAGKNNEEAILGGYNGHEVKVFMMFDKMPKASEYADRLKSIAGDYADELAGIWPAKDDGEAKVKFPELVGMAWFGYSHYTWSELMSAGGRPAYLYYFTKQNGALGDWHSGELPYFYGNIPDSKNYDESDRELSNTIQQYILNYVKTGNPNGNGLPKWDTYQENPTHVLQFDEKVEMVENRYLEVFHLFDKYMDEAAERAPAE